jgi:competence protein ComEA
LDDMPPWLTVERRRAIAIGLIAVLALAVVARHLTGSHAPSADTARAAAALASPPATTTTAATAFFVDVVGAVHRPGLYRLPDGSRIADAVRRAGGATRRADLALVNLAAPLSDGVQVVVPVRGAAIPSAAGPGGAPVGPVHLNSATLEELDALPGVGPVTAQKILDYRQKNGPFTSVDDLDAVPGIGPARLDTLRDLVAP